MDSVKYILGLPETNGDIELYPVQLKNHDDFMKHANILTISYDHVDMDDLKGRHGDIEIKLLDILFGFYSNDEQRKLLINALIKIFSHVCRKNVEFDEETISFIVEGCDFRIDNFNYDEIREIILKQNLIFTPKVYKNELVQKWVNDAIKVRARNSFECTIEDMITTIIAFNGMDSDILKEKSIYHVKAIFQRILKYHNFLTAVIFKNVDKQGNLIASHFAEKIDMLKNPYDDVIKDSSHHQHIKDSINGKM